MLIRALTSYLFSVCIVSLAACGGAGERAQDHLTTAKALYDSKNFDKASLELRNVLQIEPNHVEARYIYARILEEQKQDVRAALGNYIKVAELDKAHVEARARAGRIYLLGGAPDKALAMAEEILALDTNNVAGLTLRGSVKARNSEIDAAVADADAALSRDANFADAVILRASLYLKKNDIQNAVALIQTHIDENPADINYYTVLAQINADAKNFDAAANAIAKIIELQPKELLHRLRLASLYAAQKDMSRAESVLRDAVGALPETPDAKLALVDFLSRNQQLAKAEQDLKQFIADDAADYKLQFGLATLYLRQNKIDDAKVIYNGVIKSAGTRPDALTARVKLAELFIQENKLAETEKLVAEVIAANPDDESALLLRGSVRLNKNDSVGAIGDFRTVLKNEPDNTRAMILLAQAHMENNEWALARDTLQKAASDEPDNIPVGVRFANVLLQLEDNNKAIEYLEHLEKRFPSNLAVEETLFKAYLAVNAVEKAKTISAQIAKNYPNSAMGYYLSGMALQQEKRYADSVKKFEQALAKQPDAIQPLTSMISSLIAQKNTDQALHVLNKTVSAQPKHIKAHLLLGEVYYSMKRFPDAEKAYKQALSLNPAAASPYRSLASVYLSQNNSVDAIQVLRDGIKAAAVKEPLQSMLANIYERSGKIEEAIALYEEQVTANPKSNAAANNLAMMLAEHRKDDNSLRRAKELIQPIVTSDNPLYLDTVGWVHYNLKDFNQALTPLEKAVQIAPEFPVLRYHLGMTQFQVGNKAEAITNLEKAVNAKVPFDGIEQAKSTLQQLADL